MCYDCNVSEKISPSEIFEWRIRQHSHGLANRVCQAGGGELLLTMLELFVTETEKNTGKIVFSAGLAGTMQALGYYTTLYKPIQTGAAVTKNNLLKSRDLEFMKYVDSYMETFSTYLFKSDSTPIIAAALEGVEIDVDLIYQDYMTFSRNFECIVTDGTLGLSTPITRKFLEADLVKNLSLPVVLVAPAESSSINNTIMALQQAQNSGVSLRGVVLSTSAGLVDEESVTIRLIQEYTGVRVCGIFNKLKDEFEVNPNDVIANIITDVDVQYLFNVEIAKLKSC